MAIIADLGSIRTSIELPIKGWNKNYGKITDDVKKYPKTTDKSLNKANKLWGLHTKNLKAASLGMVAFGTATVTALGFAVNAAGDFQQSMTNTQAVAGATTEELKELTSFAREMGKQTVFSATESANAMLSLASAGQEADEIMNSLKGTLDLAAATNSDLSFASKTVASTLSQFGLAASESDRIANVFTATISASQANMDKLATSMSVVGPVAKSIGLSLEETTSILGSLFNAGLDASTAGTSLRQAIAQLLKPTDDAKDALKGLNVETVDSGGKLRGITDIIRDLEKSGLSAADALTIFGVRAGPGMLALVSQGADAIEDLTAKVTDTTKASEIAALQVDTFQGQVKLLKSAFSELQITVGNEVLPVLTEYTTKLSGIINFTSDWAAENPILTSTLVKLGGAVGVVSLGLGALGFGALGAAKVAGVLKLMAIDVSILAGALGGGAGIAVIAGVGFSLAFGLASVALALKGLIAPSKDAGGAIDRITESVWDSTASLEANLTALKNVNIEAKDLRNTFPDVFTGTQIAGVKEYATQAAAAGEGLGTVVDKLLLIEKSREKSLEGQLATLRLTLESMRVDPKTIDAQIKKEKQRLEEAVIGSEAHTKALKRLEAQALKTGKAALLRLAQSTTQQKAATSGLQSEADKQVAVIKQRTKLETDFIKVNGIIQLGLVEKNVEEILTLHGKETKEKRDIRLKERQEGRKSRDKDLKEALFIPETVAKKVIKIREKTADESMQIDADGAVEFGKIQSVVRKEVDKTNRLVLDVTDQQIAAGERKGAALVDERNKEDKALNAARISWEDFGGTVADVFANVTRTSRVFNDTWIGVMTDWAIVNRKVLSTVSDLWQGKADSVVGSAVSIFGTMTSLIDSIVDAKRQMSRLESAERAERIERTAEIRGISFAEAAKIEAEETLSEADKKAARARGATRRGTRAGRATQERFPFPGAIPTGGIQFPSTTAKPIIIDRPATEIFIPRRPEGTDRFGRPVAGTVAMAPARTGGNVTFGDIIIQLPEGSEIQNLDSADWERIMRDSIQPAAEAIGLRFSRADNVMAS